MVVAEGALEIERNYRLDVALEVVWVKYLLDCLDIIHQCKVLVLLPMFHWVVTDG